MRIILAFILLFTCLTLFGKTENTFAPPPIQVTISGKIEGQIKAKIQLAYHLYDKTYVKDSSYTDAEGNFKFIGEYEPGCYIVYLSEIYKQIPIIINNEKEIVLTAKIVNDEPKTTIIRSEENSVYYELIDFFTARREKFLQMETYYKDKTSEAEKLEFKKIQKEYSAETEAFLLKTLADNPTLFVPKYIKATQNPPEFTCDKSFSSEKCTELEFQYYFEHFFDKIDFGDARMVRTDILATKVDYFFDKLVTQRPEDLIPQLDLLLQRKEMDPEVFKTILISSVNKYARSKNIGFDAVYVHLVDEYYRKGKAEWTEAEQKQKMLDNADRLRPILIGQKMENFKFTDAQTNMEFELYSVKGNKILLYCYYNPSKELAEIKKFALEEEGKGIKTVVIFIDNSPDKLKQYREALSENGRLVPNLYALTISEKEYKTLQTKLNLDSGRTYLLDQNFNILFKQFSMWQLPEVMSRFGE